MTSEAAHYRDPNAEEREAPQAERQVTFADAETMFRTLGVQDLAVRILA
ncbi:hypothetical protein [Nesterenkonia pannonica]|nr:hypothetical protein [Nesterenkonia pannonica]